MKKTLFLMLSINSLASAASPALYTVSQRVPRAFGLLVGHGLATGVVDHYQNRLRQGQLFDVFNTAISQNSNAAESFFQRQQTRAVGVSLLGKLKRIILMRGMGVTAGHLANNKLADSIGRYIPYVALPTSLGMYAISSLPGCNWIAEKAIANPYFESASWALAAGCLALNKYNK